MNRQVSRDIPLFVEEDEACKVGAWMNGQEPMSLIDAFREVFLIGLQGLDMDDPKIKKEVGFYVRENSSFRVGWRMPKNDWLARYREETN